MAIWAMRVSRVGKTPRNSLRGNGRAVLAGALVAIVVLAIIAFVLMRFSRTLPIRKFFAYSSVLIAVLAVGLIGKGSAALQEAGYLPVTPWPGFP